MTNPVDIIGRELHIGDFVVFTNNVYEVKGLGKANASYHGYGTVQIMLANPSKTTRPQKKHSGDMCLIPKEDYLVYLLKKK
jgi:hypothetical protein